jgi:hypothetical protein
MTRDSIGMAIYFGGYEKLKQKINERGSSYRYSQLLMASAIVGGLSWLAVVPIDVVKTEL